MDQKIKPVRKPVTAEDLGLNPPAGAHATAVLNNVGNGIMIGGIYPLTYGIYRTIYPSPQQNAQKKLHAKIGVAFMTAGAIIGAVLGEIEGRRLKAYRDTVNDAIAKESNRVTELEAKLEASNKKWEAREVAAKDVSETAEIAR